MNENGPWTIGELSELVLRVLHSSGLLEADYAGQPSGRVSAIPQERTIRWYASLGLLDKPLAMRGRTALYGRRHLHQLVAIKRLQAQGRSVAQVQEDLLGATDATLEGIAHLPSELLDASSGFEPETGRNKFSLSRRPRFWAEDEDDVDSVRRGETFATVARAARIVGDRADDDTVAFGEGPDVVGEVAESGAEAERDATADEGASGAVVGGTGAAVRRGARTARRAAAEGAGRGARAARGATAEGVEGVGVVAAVRLGNDVTLLLGAATRPLNAEDLARLEEAAGPLLELLRGRGLDGPDPGRDTR